MNALIVDDNPLVCVSLERMLAKRGIAGVSVGTGAGAVAEIRRSVYALIFLDIHLPDANGVEMVAEIRRLAPGSHVLVMSSDATEELAQRAIAGGALRCFDKSRGPSRIIAETLEAVGALPPAAEHAGAPGTLTPARTS